MALLKVLKSYYKMLKKKIKALDCSHTDDCYSNDLNFGDQIVKQLLRFFPFKANIDIIKSKEGLNNLKVRCPKTNFLKNI